jgi:hypothetical protein
MVDLDKHTRQYYPVYNSSGFATYAMSDAMFIGSPYLMDLESSAEAGRVLKEELDLEFDKVLRQCEEMGFDPEPEPLYTVPLRHTVRKTPNSTDTLPQHTHRDPKPTRQDRQIEAQDFLVNTPNIFSSPWAKIALEIGIGIVTAAITYSIGLH